MKPKDLIVKSLQEKIFLKLSEFGFNFSTSALKFSRKWNDFTHSIVISPSKSNVENFLVQFYTGFGISSLKYAKWHLKEYGHKPPNDSVAGEGDWNLQGWTYPKYNSIIKHNFDIADKNDRQRVLNILQSDIIDIGIPFLEKYSNWEIAAERLIEKGLFHSKASDFFLLAGMKDKAYQCLKDGDNLSWKQFPDEPDAIKLRLKKHFNE